MIILLEHVFNQIHTVLKVPFLEQVLELCVKTCEVNTVVITHHGDVSIESVIGNLCYHRCPYRVR